MRKKQIVKQKLLAPFQDSNSHDLSLKQMALAIYALSLKNCFTLGLTDRPLFLKKLQALKNQCVDVQFRYAFQDNAILGDHWCTVAARIVGGKLEFFVLDALIGISMINHIDEILTHCPDAKITGSFLHLQLDGKNCAYFALHHLMVMPFDIHEKLAQETRQESFFYARRNVHFQKQVKILNELPCELGAFYENTQHPDRSKLFARNYLREDGTRLEEFLKDKFTHLEMETKGEVGSAIRIQKERIKAQVAPIVLALKDTELELIFKERNGLNFLDRLLVKSPESKAEPVPFSHQALMVPKLLLPQKPLRTCDEEKLSLRAGFRIVGKVLGLFVLANQSALPEPKEAASKNSFQNK